MEPFAFSRATDPAQAIKAGASASTAQQGAEVRFVAGGTTLIDLMKLDVERPSRVIDINHLPLAEVERTSDGGLKIGALVRNSDLANNADVQRDYAVLSQALLAGASGQLRNMATTGGNLLQRTRCPYFMDIGFAQCNKRAPGTGCGAIDGYNRIHAILGVSSKCIAVHPSDMCVALAALDATVRVQGHNGERRIPITGFHRLPGETPQIDANLEHGELILSIDLPPSPYAAHCHYLKVRDRASYEFALVSAAAALELDGSTIRSARIALGGVAHKPWRAESAERLLTGKSVDAAAFEAAGREAVTGAKPQRDNAFKLEMARRAVERALAAAGGIA